VTTNTALTINYRLNKVQKQHTSHAS